MAKSYFVLAWESPDHGVLVYGTDRCNGRLYVADLNRARRYPTEAHAEDVRDPHEHIREITVL